MKQETSWRFGHYLGDFINVIIGIILTKSIYLEPQYSLSWGILRCFKHLKHLCLGTYIL